MNLDEAAQTYITESRELLEDMEGALLALERAPNDDDLINRVFRAAHTIKGSAGLFGYDHIIAFTHGLENLLDEVRKCLVPVTTDLITLLMRSKDHLVSLIDGLLTNEQADAEEEASLTGMINAYRAGNAPLTQIRPEPVSPEPAGSGHDEAYSITVRLGRDAFRQGFAPGILFTNLEKLGHILEVIPLMDALPHLEALQPEDCYLGWEISLQTGASKVDIAGLFEFVDAEVHILPPKSCLDVFRHRIEQLPQDDAALGQMLVQVGTLTPDELQHALNTKRESGEMVGKILVDKGAVQPEVIHEALKKQEKVRSAQQKEISFVRVDAAKLDKLVNLLGELVTGSANLNEISKRLGNNDLLAAVSDITTTLEEMRETTLGLRMVPISATFNRFHRVVRDTAQELNKSIRLEIYGGDTELDKTVVDKIGDPLMHLVRNAMDHGIEPPHERTRIGKEAEGRVTLNAYHETGTIVIEISDDGRGLDPERIRTIAVQRGLIKPSQNLSRQEIYQLIFEPGFSTAEKVSNISGRGVGMDVVRRNIEALRGRVEIASTLGQGTKMSIYLPLTLAIIDGFHVSLAGDPMIVPLDMMVECISLSKVSQVGLEDSDYIKLRNEVLPLIRLQSYLNHKLEICVPTAQQRVVVVQFSGMKVGLLVDSLHGEVQAVIKPIGRVFQGLAGFAGFTILGNGRVAMILDIPGLIQDVARREQQTQENINRESRVHRALRKDTIQAS